jgi:hypothetical protein
MGILNIVFGSIFLLCYVCSGLSLVTNAGAGGGGGFGGGMDQAAMWNFMTNEVPGYVAFSAGNVLLNLLASILLLTSGIGLLNMRSWARVGSIVYSILTILMQIAALVYQLAFVNPAMTRFFREFAGRGGLPDMSPFMTIITVISVIVYVILMIYGIILLIVMLNPRVSAAFAGHAPVGEYEAERPDDGDDYERRRRRDWGE